MGSNTRPDAWGGGETFFAPTDLFDLYVDGGIEIVTPKPGADGGLALRTVVQPDGDLLFYIDDPFWEVGEDLRRDHEGRVARVIQSVRRLRALVRAGKGLAPAAALGFLLQSGLDLFVWGEARAALYGLALTAAPLGIKWSIAGGFRWALARRLRRRL